MTASDRGIVDVLSRRSVNETVARLRGILEAKGITLFAQVDHSGEAAKVGMTMPPTKLLIFGSPKAGTPVMLAAPSIALDLPLKILVWQLPTPGSPTPSEPGDKPSQLTSVNATREGAAGETASFRPHPVRDHQPRCGELQQRELVCRHRRA